MQPFPTHKTSSKTEDEEPLNAPFLFGFFGMAIVERIESW